MSFLKHLVDWNLVGLKVVLCPALQLCYEVMWRHGSCVCIFLLSRSSFTRLCSHIRLQRQYLPSSRLDPPAPLNNSPVPLESLSAVWVCGSYHLRRERGARQTRWDVKAWELAERPACNSEITLKGRTYLCFVNVLLPLHPKVGVELWCRHPPNFYFFLCALLFPKGPFGFCAYRYNRAFL